MSILIKEPLVRRKVIQKDCSVVQNSDPLEITSNEIVSLKSDLKNATDLFKDNADFINYGISAMTNTFKQKK
ncbi:MAG: hypothetical protein ACI83B_001588 [Sediminicola sp.]|jgi:hypothetical protein